MKTLLIVGSLVAATAAPAAASAATRCINPQTNTATGALVGAAGGAAAGSLLAGRHNRGEGAILGAVGGALLGGAIGHNQVKCPDGYYAYDDQTQQYYDNNGRVYAPQGGGYGPPPPQGAGYGPPPQGGGYGPPPQGGGYGPPPQGGGYGGGWWAGAPTSTGERIAYLRERIQRAADAGRIGPRDARHSYMDLDDVQRQYNRLRARDGGHLNGPDRAYIQDRLDRARTILRDNVREND